MNTTSTTQKEKFTKYQVFIVAILAILQFTIILDFMVLSPLSAQLLEEMDLRPDQFSNVVSAYAFAAGIFGVLAAGFADRFDRKKLLLIFYTGFILGTVLCALATSYEFLLIARIVTGIFGGVMGAVSFAIITDLFKMEMRGRVMGFVQMAFAASQILGIPIGLVLARDISWHAPFWMITIFSVVVGAIILIYMKPVTGHLVLEKKSEKSPFLHLWHTASQPDYLFAFLATTLLATGGFMLMPFGSAFSVNNLKINQDDLPILYTVVGVFSIIFGPLVGKLSDKTGKYTMFLIGSMISGIMVYVYTGLDVTPLYIVIILNVILFVGISARMISSSALFTAIPKPQDRGAFMSINSSVQQLAGGIAAWVAGKIVVQDVSSKKLLHYPTLGYVVLASMLITVVLMYFLNKRVSKVKSRTFEVPQA